MKNTQAKNRITLKSVSGMSLVEMMIALGVATALGLGITQLVLNNQRAMVGNQRTNDFNDLIMTLRSQMSNPAFCAGVFQNETGANPLAAGTWTPGTAGGANLTAITIPSPNQTLIVKNDGVTPAILGTPYGSGLKITTARAQWDGTMVNNRTYLGTLLITAERSEAGATQTLGSRFVSAEIKLRFTDNSALGLGGAVDSCIGDGVFDVPRAEFIVAQTAPADCIGSTGTAIQECLDMAATAGGGTVLVKSGTYAQIEDIEIASNVTLRGESGMILNGMTSEIAGSINLIAHSNTVIENLTLEQGTNSGTYATGLMIRGSNVSVRNNRFMNSGGQSSQSAISVVGAFNESFNSIRIEGNLFEDFRGGGLTAAIQFRAEGTGMIIDSIITNNLFRTATPIWETKHLSLNRAFNTIISNNHFVNGGIIFSAVGHTSIQNNIIIGLGDFGIEGATSGRQSLVIADNIFNNWDTGLQITGASDSSFNISGNQITNSDIGISLRGSSRSATITGNQIRLRSATTDTSGILLRQDIQYEVSNNYIEDAKIAIDAQTTVLGGLTGGNISSNSFRRQGSGSSTASCGGRSNIYLGICILGSRATISSNIFINYNDNATDYGIRAADSMATSSAIQIMGNNFGLINQEQILTKNSATQVFVTHMWDTHIRGTASLHGTAHFSGVPTGASYTQGSLTVSPIDSGGNSNNTILGVVSGMTNLMRVTGSGTMEVRGPIEVTGSASGGNVPHRCLRRSQNSSNTVSCSEGEIAIGGGAICTAGYLLERSFPTGSTLSGWTARCISRTDGTIASGAGTVYAVCCRR
jgi:hypothetical protein